MCTVVIAAQGTRLGAKWVGVKAGVSEEGDGKAGGAMVQY